MDTSDLSLYLTSYQNQNFCILQRVSDLLDHNISVFCLFLCSDNLKELNKKGLYVSENQIMSLR